MPAHRLPPVRFLAGAVAVVAIPSEVTEATERAFDEALGQVISAGVRAIILDCSEVRRINSHGIGFLVALHAQARRRGQRLSTYGLSDRCRQIFTLTRLQDEIPMFHSEAEALAAAHRAKPRRS